MPFDYAFTLPPRLAVPAAYPALTSPQMGRHHILGRKYIQLLLALARETGVSDGVLKRFAGWPNPDSSSNIPAETEFNGRFFWSPFNIFIGPDGNHRGFDPGSGVEQVCPPGLNRRHPGRWNALRAIPVYFERIGVNLRALVSLEDNAVMNMKLNNTGEEIKSDLTRLIKEVIATETGDKVFMYDFHENEWVAIKQSIVVDRFINQTHDVEGLYNFAVDNKLLVGRNWSNRIADDRFILNPNV